VTPRVALTIAGSDSGGGAGVQADLKTFAAYGVYGCTAITAITAQNTTAVRAIHVLDASIVVEQIDTVLDDFTIAAVKTGMLASAAIIEAVADLAAAGRLPNLVVDPVMVASTGRTLVGDDAVHAYRTALFPHAFVVTPNMHEAAVLLDTPITSLTEQVAAAQALGELGSAWTIVKGGHALADTSDIAVDVVVRGTDVFAMLNSPRIDTPNTHGSGCTFVAAIAAGLARGSDPSVAISDAKQFVHAAITRAASWKLGTGHGPLDHFGASRESENS
jgi:hydroxymethylpyrimidine/phosphomethylpyrimidine kinase